MLTPGCCLLRFGQRRKRPGWFKDHYAQWRNSQLQRCRAAMRGSGFRNRPAAVTHVAAAKYLRIRVEDFTVFARFRYADPIFFVWRWRKIAHYDHKLLTTEAIADERNYRVFTIVKIDPFEAPTLKIDFIQRRLRFIQVVQRCAERLEFAT